MKKILFFAVCLLAMASCQNAGPTDTETTGADTTAVETPAAATPEVSCFYLAEGKDTTWASLTIAADGTVTGSFDWVPWEKDSARGTLTGKKDGEVITAMYDYMIEGSQQKEEKMFKISGGQMFEANGELTEGEGGILKLKDPAKVEWKAFAKMECR